MTREEYELRKLRLKEERQAGLELVEACYQAQLRALEMVWGSGPGQQAPVVSSASQSPAPATQPAPRRKLGQVYNDVIGVYWKLPQTFDRNDVCRALGYEPDRNTLFRILAELVQDGRLLIARRGGGRVPTTYSRPEAAPGTSHA
jgi:hypothetical protein